MLYMPRLYRDDSIHLRSWILLNQEAMLFVHESHTPGVRWRAVLASLCRELRVTGFFYLSEM